MLSNRTRTVLANAAVAIVIVGVGFGLVAATSSSGSAALERHSHAHWVSELEHSAAVREADHDRSHARWVAERTRASHGYGADWWSTNTPDWTCIHNFEERGNEPPANYFGFVPYGGGMDMAEQSALALSILHAAGWGAWSTAPLCGL